MPDERPEPRRRLCVAREQIQGDWVTFDAAQTHYLADVLRLGPGERIAVFDAEGQTSLEVEWLGADRGGAAGCVVGQAVAAPEPRTRLVVHPAMLQRSKMEQVLQKLVEVGASAVRPVLTARSLVPSVPDESKLVRWRGIMREAAEQCGRGLVPELLPVVRFEEALRDAVACGPALLAYELTRRTVSLSEAAAGLRASGSPEVALFVGPEGGYAPEEAELARELGVTFVSLGARLLRTETASPVFAALMLYALDDLG